MICLARGASHVLDVKPLFLGAHGGRLRDDQGYALMVAQGDRLQRTEYAVLVDRFESLTHGTSSLHTVGISRPERRHWSPAPIDVRSSRYRRIGPTRDRRLPRVRARRAGAQN